MQNSFFGLKIEIGTKPFLVKNEVFNRKTEKD